MLLNWGETATDLVIDPEYLSNMEHPRTTLASYAGLRSGYGSGIASTSVEGFPMLGHGGGIEGFASLYGYSTSRDVGYVVLLNSTHSPEAMRRIAQLAVRYLKADVEPPPKPTGDGRGRHACDSTRATTTTPTRATRRSRSSNGCCRAERLRVNGDRLEATPVFGAGA